LISWSNPSANLSLGMIAMLKAKICGDDCFPKDVKTCVGINMVNYKNHLVRFMPVRRAAQRKRAFFVIFSTMIGAIALARMMPETAMRQRILDTANTIPIRRWRPSVAVPSD
jgi:hypothetical protein